MLALTTDVLLCHLSFNKAGQAALADIRYPALRLSPRPGRAGRQSIPGAQAITQTDLRVRCGGTEGLQDQEQEGQMPAENCVEVHHLK